ncbi:MAG: class I SAM-dependent methyltransferase [Chloroflexota bacterium]
MDKNREVFDAIAESWYRVRHWPLLREELECLAGRWRGGRLLNVGCGHGADFLPFRHVFELWGVDFSLPMLRQAQRYSTKFGLEARLVRGDMRALPFGDGTFDWAIAVASYHHLRDSGTRAVALAELKRVLKDGGEAFLSVWNKDQPRFWFRSREQLVPWRSRGGTRYRYYHLFSYGEMRRALTEAGFGVLHLGPEKRYHFPVRRFSHNVCALVRK